MKKNRVRLTESDLHKIVKESVNNVLQQVFCENAKTNMSKKRGKLVRQYKDYLKMGTNPYNPKEKEEDLARKILDVIDKQEREEQRLEDKERGEMFKSYKNGYGV